MLLSVFTKWLAGTSLRHFIQLTTWVIPTLQTIHILSIALLFSAAILVDLRMLRVFDRDQALSHVAKRFLPVIWPVLAILLTSGALLIIAEPGRSLQNATFYIKMALLAAAIAVTLFLQWSIGSDESFWDRTAPRRLGGYLAATISISVWSGVIFAGRWIAYTVVS